MLILHLPEGIKSRSFIVRSGIILACIAVCLSLLYFFVRKNDIIPSPQVRVIDNAYMEQERTAYRLVGTDPEPLQRMFDQDMQDGINDELTKSHVYFLMNRYFNNGGNIYEIYDYINSRPKLAFLKDASALYPAIFQLIDDRALQPTASPVSSLAYLAYLETLERNGYAGIALRGTGAHQYAQLAYIAQQEPEILDPAVNATQNILMKKNKALFFAERAKRDVMPIFEGQADKIPARDKVVGLSHYAVALRYLKLLEVEFSSPKTAREIFVLCRQMIQRNNLPELAPFTGLLDASTLLFDAESSADEVRQALDPILVLNSRDTAQQNPTIMKIISSKNRVEPADSRLSSLIMMRVGVFDRTNIIALAQRVPEFKQWLITAGWTEADFEI